MSNAVLAALLQGLALPYALVLAIPGPNILLVLRAGMAGSRWDAVSTALGLACGASAITALVALGAGLLPSIRWVECGGAVVFSALMIRAALRSFRGLALMPEDPRRLTVQRDRAGFALGFLVSASNPLTIAFFASAFLAHAVLRAPAELATSCIVVFVMAGLWFLSLAAFFSMDGVRKVYDAAGRPLQLAVGTALIVFAGLALLRVVEI